MRGEGDILLVSTYELGHSPAGVAWPAAFLRRAGFRPAALDLAVEPFGEERVRRARLVALSVHMHTALRLGLEAAARVRAVKPAAVLCFHGLYAPLNSRRLVAAGAAAVLGGECEDDLVALARAVEAGGDLSGFVRGGGAGASLGRLDFPVPDRRGLPPLERYARLALPDGSQRTAGYAEATRGCKYLCAALPHPAPLPRPVLRGAGGGGGRGRGQAGGRRRAVNFC